MANFDDVATNEHIQAIADAVRRVTRSNASMTIPEIAAILGTLNLVEVREVEVSIEQGMTTLYGVTQYDKTVKHLFLFFPKDYTAGKVFGDIAPTVVVQDSGYIDFTLARAHAEGDIKSVVMLDFLVSDEATTRGYFIQNMDYTQILENAVNGVPVKSGRGEGTVVSFNVTEPSSGINIAGCKAWFWRAFNTSTNTLYLAATQPSYDQISVGPNASYQASGNWGITVGDEISIVNDIRVDFAVVTSVEGNAIGLDRTIFTEAREDTRDFRYIVIDYNNPYAGVYDYSSGAVALGNATKALQVGAISFGYSTMAAGAYSVAGGRGSKAGFLGVAIGNYAEAKGTYSTAFGSETLAEGSCAFVAGSGANAFGPYAASIGRFTKAHKQASQAFGSEAEAWADFSTAFGYKTSATNKAQFVVGRYNKETDPSHGNTDVVQELFIVGNGSSAARSNAFVVTNLGSVVLHDSVVGQNIYAAVVAGSGNTVNGSNSIIAGRQGVINSADCILVGRTNDDGVTAEINANNSAAFGMGVKVLSGHRSSTVTGFGTKSSNPYCLIGGLYNAGIANNLFEIGNGNKTTGSNAFAVSRTGTARLGADPVDTMDATTKRYVDNSFTNYVKKTDYASAYNAGVTKVPSADDSGLNVLNGNLTIWKATDMEFVGVPSQVKLGANEHRPITPYNQHKSVFYGLSKAAGVDLSSTTAGETPPDAGNAGVYPEAAKTAIKNMLGIVGEQYYTFMAELDTIEYDIYISGITKKSYIGTISELRRELAGKYVPISGGWLVVGNDRLYSLRYVYFDTSNNIRLYYYDASNETKSKYINNAYMSWCACAPI